MNAPRSYFVRYRTTTNACLRVRAAVSSRFGDLADAETRATTIRQMNPAAQPEVEIIASNKWPEIYRHCEGSEAQAIGSPCFRCGKVLS